MSGKQEVLNEAQPLEIIVKTSSSVTNLVQLAFSIFTENTKNTFCQIHVSNMHGLGASGLLGDKCAIKVPRTLEPPREGVAAPRGDVVHGCVRSGRPGAQSRAPETIPRGPEIQSRHRKRGSGRAGPSQGSQGPH